MASSSSSALVSKVTIASEQELAAKEPLVNNEDRSKSEKASDDAEASLLIGTELDAKTKHSVLKKLTRAPRYFDEQHKNNDVGKKKKPKKRHKRCYICADASHEGKRCKKVNACLICSKKGHLTIDCSEKDVKEDHASTLCLKCGNTGHDMFSCTNQYDSEDIQVMECYVCKQVGHLCCVDEKAEGQLKASCYNCGQSGHFGSECTNKPVCPKCGENVHSKRKCPKVKSGEKDGAATHARKKMSRNARRRKKRNQTQASVNQPQPMGVWSPLAMGPCYGRPPTGYQPNTVWRPPGVGPYYGQPRSNVWLSPAAAAARSNPSHHHGGALPPHQHAYHHSAGPPHQCWNPHIGAQITQMPMNRGIGIARPPHQHWYPPIGAQITQMPINHGSRVVLPQTVTVPEWHFEGRTKLLQPYANRGTNIQRHRAESAAPSSASLPGLNQQSTNL